MKGDDSVSNDTIQKSKPLYGRTVRRPGWLLWFSIGTRAFHQVGAAIFLCFFLLGNDITIPAGYIYLAGISGIVLFFAEAMRHREVYREISGLITFTKCILLGAGVHGLLPAAPAVLTAFLLASFGSHVPKNIRHRRLY